MNTDVLKLELIKALDELDWYRQRDEENKAENADLARYAADPHPVPAVVFGITQKDSRLRVDIQAASDMAFELVIEPPVDYEKAIADICHVAPAMMLYDAALMETYDDGGRTKIPVIASEPVKDFVKRYKAHLVNISVSLPPFERIPTKGAI